MAAATAARTLGTLRMVFTMKITAAVLTLLGHRNLLCDKLYSCLLRRKNQIKTYIPPCCNFPFNLKAIYGTVLFYNLLWDGQAMSTKQPKKKLCWNCEGRVTLQDENCPFCGVYLSPLGKVGESENKETLFAPPYRVEESDQEEQQVPAAPYAVQEESVSSRSQEAVKVASKIAASPLLTSEMQTIVLPLILLLTGSVLFIFGIALMLFSQNGVLTLQWNGEHWYLFFIFSLPLLYFGWRYLQKDVVEE